MKIIRVSKCGECPHIENYFLELNGEPFCAHPQAEVRDINDPDTIPEWCPLEEVEE